MILPNTAAEFRLFADFLRSLKQPMRVVFEATGPITVRLRTSYRLKAFIWS